MSAARATVLVVGAGTIALKAVGPVGVSGRRLPARVTELLEMVAPAILAALVITETFASGRWLVLDARLEREVGWDAILAANGDHSRAKPNPVLYLEALEVLGVRADEAVVFEDSPNGVRAGKAAGIFTVGIPNSVTRDYGLEEADLIVDSLADLPPDELLARFS